MPGWASYPTNASFEGVRTNNSVKMTMQGRMLHVDVPSGTASVAFYDMRGNRIKAGTQGPGVKSYTLHDMPKGLYAVRVEGDQLDETRRIVVY